METAAWKILHCHVNPATSTNPIKRMGGMILKRKSRTILVSNAARQLVRLVQVKIEPANYEVMCAFRNEMSSRRLLLMSLILQALTRTSRILMDML